MNNYYLERAQCVSIAPLPGTAICENVFYNG